MEWLLPFLSNQSNESHEVSEVESRERRVELLALRQEVNEERRKRKLLPITLFTPGDWVDDMHPSEIHERIGRPGEDRHMNGEDHRPPPAEVDPFDEFADDTQALPKGWLKDELAAFSESGSMLLTCAAIVAKQKARKEQKQLPRRVAA